MKRGVVRVAEAVYNFANPFVDPSWLSWPWYVIAISAAKLLDWLDPVPPRSGRPHGVSGS